MEEAETLDTMLHLHGSTQPPYNWTGSKFQAITKLKSEESSLGWVLVLESYIWRDEVVVEIQLAYLRSKSVSIATSYHIYTMTFCVVANRTTEVVNAEALKAIETFTP
jgi:hypothetical protein